MKRSEINRLIGDAIRFFDRMKFHLPPWGYWSPDDWKHREDCCREIVENQLGWDLTDFGSGDFHRTGLLLFTIRNGGPASVSKPYAEKIMIVEEGQLTPLHFHWTKTEDIINRGGGNLLMRLIPSDESEGLSDRGFSVSIDGIARKFSAGDTVRLRPGESITLPAKLYHEFYGEKGSGKILVGEVSSVNDDQTDNRFFGEVGRFPDIEEDARPRYLLVGDYPSYTPQQ